MIVCSWLANVWCLKFMVCARSHSIHTRTQAQTLKTLVHAVTQYTQARMLKHSFTCHVRAKKHLRGLQACVLRSLGIVNVFQFWVRCYFVVYQCSPDRRVYVLVCVNGAAVMDCVQQLFTKYLCINVCICVCMWVVFDSGMNVTAVVDCVQQLFTEYLCINVCMCMYVCVCVQSLT
jgi:hypothetical protein